MDSETLNLLYADSSKELIDNAIVHLKAMDWTYHYSDDNKAFTKGAKLKSTMFKSLDTINNNEIAAILFDTYCRFLNDGCWFRIGWINPYKTKKG